MRVRRILWNVLVFIRPLETDCEPEGLAAVRKNTKTNEDCCDPKGRASK